MQAQWEEFQVNFEAGAQRIERFGPHPAPSAYFDSIVKWAACQLRRICIVAGSVRVEKLELGKLGKQSRHWRACSEDLPDEARSAPPDAAAGDHSKSGKLPGTVRGGEHEVARMEVR